MATPIMRVNTVRLTFSVLFIGLLLATPAVVLVDAIFEREAQNETAANRIGTQFIWPENPHAADPEVTLRILSEAATTTASNVLRSTANVSRSDQKRITHYIFMGRDRTALFDEFALTEGRWLTPIESRANLAVVSSARADEGNNVGVPAIFGDRYELTFAPLGEAFDFLPSPGRYVVESPNNAAINRFLTIVHQRLLEAGVTDLTVTDLLPDQIRVPVEKNGNLEILAYILTGVATLVIAFRLLRETKRIGVLRLLGHPAMRIWYLVVGRLQLASFLIGLSTCIGVSLAVPGVDVLFQRILAVTFSQITAIGFMATMSVGLVIINRIQVSDLIKGSLQ